MLVVAVTLLDIGLSSSEDGGLAGEFSGLGGNEVLLPFSALLASSRTSCDLSTELLFAGDADFLPVWPG